jgi:thymidylate synthase (FAD)
MGDRDIITRWLKSGEESMIEMVDAAFFIVCSRVVSHELVRHRLASFQQESQRFVAYEDEEFEDLFVFPEEYVGTETAHEFEDAYYRTVESYRRLKDEGVPKQLRRYVLPNAMRTRMIMKANLREWRHILKLRMHKSAQPEMRELMQQIHDQLLEQFPLIFKDIQPWLDEGERAAR